MDDVAPKGFWDGFATRRLAFARDGYTVFRASERDEDSFARLAAINRTPAMFEANAKHKGALTLANGLIEGEFAPLFVDLLFDGGYCRNAVGTHGGLLYLMNVMQTVTPGKSGPLTPPD